MALNEYYKGYITKVSVFTRQHGSITLYGAWIKCNLLMDGTFEEYVKIVPCGQCGSMKVLRLRIEEMGFKISNNRKSLTKNLAGTPVLATLVDGNCYIDRIFIDKDKPQYE